MTTSRFLLCLFLLLGLLSLGALLWKSAGLPEGRKKLVWTSDNNPARSEQITTFNALNAGLHLQLDYGNNNLQKIILQSASGVGPDLISLGSGEDIQAMVEAGILWDITEQAEAGGFGFRDATWPGAKEAITCYGKQYAYPGNAGANVLIYNKNVFDALGLPYPADTMTWDEFAALGRQIGAAAKERQRAIYAVGELNWRIFFESQRGEFFDKLGGLHIADSPELRTALQMHRDFIFRDRLMPTSVELRAQSGQGGWGKGYLNQFAAGRFAMITTGEWALLGFSRTHALQTADPSAAAKTDPLERPLRIGAALIPRFAGKEPAYRVMLRGAAINARSPNRQEALKFLRYLAGPEYSELINRNADFLPGNPQYADLGIVPGPPDLSRLELHEKTKAAMAYTYQPRMSPFLLLGDVYRVLEAQIGRLESNPGLPVEDVLRSAQDELETLLRRNLAHDPDLKKLYEERFGAPPTAP